MQRRSDRMNNEAEAIETIDDVRAWVKKYPGSGLALAWGQMLEDMDELGDDYGIEEFDEERDIQRSKGNL